MPDTVAAHAFAGMAFSSAPSRVALADRSACCSLIGRGAPRAISASLAAGVGYCGVYNPVLAQVRRLTLLSALRARWASTWPRVQPASREGAVTSASDSVAVVASSRSVADESSA